MHKKKTHLYLLIATLFFIGSSLFLYRYFVLGIPLSPEETVASWTVEANLRFSPINKMPIKAQFFIPNSPPNFATLDEYFVSHNFGVTTHISGDNRETTWSIRRATGSQSLYYRAIYRETQNTELPLAKPTRIIKQTLSDTERAAVEAITATARKSSADIQTFGSETVKLLHEKQGNAKVLLGEQAPLSNEAITSAAIQILNFANIHAMPVKLVHLTTSKRADLVTWLLIYDEKNWLFIDPANGAVGLKPNFLVWQYGSEPQFSLSGGKKAQFSLTLSPTAVSALSVAKIRGSQMASNLIKFSLLQLPLDLQQTYKILLTVPVGAFIILLLRNFIGLVTFGTFMPVLIAMAFRETHLIWGTILFSTVVTFGLLVRFYLNQLRLLLVPRLATILTVVILLMVFISIISQHLGLQKGLSVALFPMVILTMVIERMCISWDERGPGDAIIAGLGSLFAASLTYLVMSNMEIEYLVFAFPELLFILMAMILSFGQYRGYRLFELLRFKSLANSEKSPS